MQGLDNREAVQSVAAGTDIFSEFVKISFSLLLVLLVMFLMLYLFKRFSHISQSQKGYLKVVDSLAIGAKERIMLLQVGGEQVLVSSCAGEIKLLYNLMEPVDLPEEPYEKCNFTEKLQQLLSRSG